MTTNDATVSEELAEVHQKLYALAQAARRAESYYRAKNASRLAVALADAERLAEVPFAPRVEEVLNRLRNAKGVLQIPGSGGASANSHTQLMVATYRTVRNTIIDRYFPQLGDVELSVSEPIPGSDYPIIVSPLEVTWEQIAKLMVADAGVSRVLAGWRVASERVAPKLAEDASDVAFEGVWANYIPGEPSEFQREQMEAMADAMDSGWRPESYPWDEPQRTPRVIDPKKEPLWEYLRTLFVGSAGTKTVMKQVPTDPVLQGHLTTAGADLDNEADVETEIDTARRYIKDPKNKVA